jgi:hypothetical protein
MSNNEEIIKKRLYEGIQQFELSLIETELVILELEESSEKVKLYNEVSLHKDNCNLLIKLSKVLLLAYNNMTTSNFDNEYSIILENKLQDLGVSLMEIREKQAESGIFSTEQNYITVCNSLKAMIENVKEGNVEMRRRMSQLCPAC